MQRSSGPRKTASHLSESIHQDLNMYALAAGAAGISVLALAQPAEAKIVYKPANVIIGLNQHYDLDLNHDGITNFTLKRVWQLVNLILKCASILPTIEMLNGSDPLEPGSFR